MGPRDITGGGPYGVLGHWRSIRTTPGPTNRPTNRKVVAMEAVIATGGKQYRVAPGQVIKVELLAKDKGAAVEFTKVLLVNNEGQVTVEPKALASAKVLGQVVAERKENKVLVVKFKRRKNYRRHRGHRQTMTAVRITKIEV